MVANSANDSLRQAYQGSVSAIIQILNDRLAGTGIRTRAIFEGRILQLLCEATKPEQLVQETIVPQIKATLEDISPRNIRRVNINARIIQEQQLLWLDEIKKGGGDNPVLWSQELVLSRPNLMNHFFAGLKKDGPEMPAYVQDTPSGRKSKGATSISPKVVVGGVAGVGILALAGFGAWKLMLAVPESERPLPEAEAIAKGSTKSAVLKPKAAAPKATTGQPTADDFGDAVRLANSANALTPTAKTPAEWQIIAQKWGQASDLMSKVQPNSANYAIAQDRTLTYRKNQAIALKKAQ
jgi:hypothetical protein